MAGRTRLWLLAAMPALLVLAAACGSKTDTAKTESNASQSSIDELTARIQRVEMLDAWVTVSNMPVHDLDSSLQGGKVDGKYVPTLRTMVRVLALTEWSADLQPGTTKLHDSAVALLQALDAGMDVAALQKFSMTFHEDWHTWSPTVGDALARDLPPEAGGPHPSATEDTGEDGHDMATPSGVATMTMDHE